MSAEQMEVVDPNRVAAAKSILEAEKRAKQKDALIGKQKILVEVLEVIETYFNN